MKKIKICETCNKKFERNYFLSNKKHKTNSGRFCSTYCYRKGRNKFNEISFKFDTKKFEFRKPSEDLGKYDSIDQEYLLRHKNKDYDFFFKKGICDEKTAYFFGIAITDGFLLERKYGINSKPPYFGLELRDWDLDILTSISKSLRFKDKLYKSKKNTYKLYLRGDYITHDMSALGLVPRKSYITEYPLIKNKNIHKHFIRGVIDGDGSFFILQKKYLSLKIAGNDKLIYGIYLTIKNILKIKSCRLEYPKNHKNLKMKSYCTISYNQEETKLIRDWIYKTKSQLFSFRKYQNAFFEPINKTYFQEETPNKLAKKIGVSSQFIYRLIKRYNFPTTKFGRIYTIENKNLKKFYKKCFDHINNNRNEGSLSKNRKIQLLNNLKVLIKI